MNNELSSAGQRDTKESKSKMAKSEKLWFEPSDPLTSEGQGAGWTEGLRLVTPAAFVCNSGLSMHEPPVVY